MKKIACLIIFSFLLNGAATKAPSENAQVVHVLNRLTFGPRPGDIDKVKTMGVQSFIQEQLNPPAARASESDRSEGAMDLLRTYQATRKQAAQKDDSGNDAEKKKAVNEATKGVYKAVGEKFTTAKLQRAIESPNQLEEVMTDFWFNHFNISMNKGLDRLLVGAYEEEAIRPYVFGRFRDLLGATCHHPAMLFYLDNWQNTAPQSPGARGKLIGLNENYARELMELHTLGVDGGYTQQDVTELARILTGLGLPGFRKQGQGQGQAQGRGRFAGGEKVGPDGAIFSEQRHDFSEKILLGHKFAGTGEREIEDALDMLAKHPSTAHHISYQLAQYFVADNPPKALVDRLAQRFLASDGNIKAVLSELFQSPEFWDERNDNDKFKSPFRYVVSSLRAADIHPQEYKALKQFLALQGEPIYGCLTPDGYKNTKEAWLNPSALLTRLNFATGVGIGRLPGNQFDPPEYKLLGATISNGVFSAHTVETVEKEPEPMRAALLLGSPEFMRY
jgi:uncharacterized protein (DUF1800 family)